jgi:hypothetical protein
MDAVGDFPEFLDNLGQSMRSAGPLLGLAPLLRWHAGLRHPGLESQRDQPLLRCMEVAFNATAGLVSCCDDPRPGGSKLGVALRVGDGQCHKLGEGEQTRFSVVVISRGDF